MHGVKSCTVSFLRFANDRLPTMSHMIYLYMVLFIIPIVHAQSIDDTVHTHASSHESSLQNITPFCRGSSVMFSGFQSTIHGTCVTLFFRSWVLDSPLKYSIGLLGVFALPLLNEYLIQYREQIRLSFLRTRRRYESITTLHR